MSHGAGRVSMCSTPPMRRLAPIRTFLERHGRPITYGYMGERWPLEAYQTVSLHPATGNGQHLYIALKDADDSLVGLLRHFGPFGPAERVAC